jgi:NitT/TauT family transport system ATP-binding protein
MHSGGETAGRTPAFECVGLGMSYTLPGRTVEALQEISLRQEPGEFVCIVGPSGCGKTTLLKLLAGLLCPTAGEIRFPAATPGGQPRTALVFQDHGLFPWMTVLDNVAFHLEAMGVGRQERRSRGKELLSTLGLASFADLYPRVLSAGMRQRAGIARALLADPLVLLMDEPFGALDAQTRRFLQQELLRHWEERRKAVVFITHDVDEAVLLADRLLVLTGRPGKVMADFAVPLPRPRTPADTQRPEAAALKKQIWAMVEEQARFSLQALS